MARKKLKRFAEVEEFPNTFRLNELKDGGEWVEDYFGNRLPLVLELGCGKGEYTLELARRDSQRNFVGIDRKGERIWQGARKALDEGITNVAFLRMNIKDLSEAFCEEQVEEIWIPFPDPLPKKKQQKHRLLASSFIDLYRTLIEPGGRVYLKTDDGVFFEDVVKTLSDEGDVEVFAVSRDIYGDDEATEATQIQTTFEKRHLEAGKSIKYLAFGFVEKRQE